MDADFDTGECNCEIILDKRGCFSACHEAVDPTLFYTVHCRQAADDDLLFNLVVVDT